MHGRGALIVLEGCDRAGKTTQCKKLIEALTHKGILAEFISFPDRNTTTGKIIDAYLCKKEELPDKAIHLLFSANRWELEPQMRRKINEGVTLIVDRYSYSGVAFSAAKEGMDLDWCSKPEVGLLKPDVVFFLSLTPETIAKRGGFGEERYENTEFQNRVHSNFIKLHDESWQNINADQAVEDLHRELIIPTLKTIQKAKYSEMLHLW